MKRFLPLKPRFRVTPPAKRTWIPGREKETIRIEVPLLERRDAYYFGEWFEKLPEDISNRIQLPVTPEREWWPRHPHSGDQHLGQYLAQRLNEVGCPTTFQVCPLRFTVTLPAKEGHWQPRPLSTKLTQQTR